MVKLSGGTTEAIAIASIDLKSSPARENKFRACTPHSSAARERAVGRPQCTNNFSPSNTPSEVFVLPMSITSSIRKLRVGDRIMGVIDIGNTNTSLGVFDGE